MRKNLLKRKKAGYIENILFTFIFILMAGVLLITIIDTTNLLNYSNEIDQVARKYILELETTGTADAAEVKNAVSILGYQNCTVTINDNAAAPVDFGEKVSIVIEVKATPEEIGLFESNPFHRDVYECRKSRISISKAR